MAKHLIGMLDPATPEVRRFAQQLLAAEAAMGGTSAANGPVVLRVCEKLRRALVTLAGSAGFNSLLFRALALAQKQAPILLPVRVGADGILKGLEDIDRGPHNHYVEADALLLAEKIGLLVIFIGQGLTLRLTNDIWPNASFDIEDGREKEA
jgi:hypothetical protein